MDDKIKEYIINGKFDEASKFIKGTEAECIRDLLIQIGYESQSIIVYSFVNYLISKEENAELHYIASQLLSMPLCHLKGANNSSLHHARRASELEPDNVCYKENLLLFNILPDGLITLN